MTNQTLETINNNTTPLDEMTVYRRLDIALAVICLIVFVVGVPGNIAALTHFISRGRDLPTRLYTLLSLIDSMLCIFILPVGISFAYNRDKKMFGWSVLCTVWGAVWTWAPYMSVFLIAILSITRTLVCLHPLRIISKTKVIVVVVFYGIWIAIRMATPMVVEGPTFHYLNRSVECMWTSESKLLNKMSLITVIIFLANPVLPILVSCGISMYVLRSTNQNNSQSSRHGNDRKRSATITILILTGTYLFLNFPLFLYLSGFTYYYISHQPHKWLNGSVTIDSYLWNVVYIVLIGVNSLANFIVYFYRIKQFRGFLCQWFTRSRVSVVSTMHQFSPVLSTLHEAISPKLSPEHSKSKKNGSSFHSQSTQSSSGFQSSSVFQSSSILQSSLKQRQLSIKPHQRSDRVKTNVIKANSSNVMFSKRHKLCSADSVELEIESVFIL